VTSKECRWLPRHRLSKGSRAVWDPVAVPDRGEPVARSGELKASARDLLAVVELRRQSQPERTSAEARHLKLDASGTTSPRPPLSPPVTGCRLVATPLPRSDLRSPQKAGNLTTTASQKRSSCERRERPIRASGGGRVSSHNPTLSGQALRAAVDSAFPFDCDSTVGLRDVKASPRSLLGLAGRPLAASARRPGKARGEDADVSAVAAHRPSDPAGARNLSRARSGAVRARRHARLVLEARTLDRPGRRPPGRGPAHRSRPTPAMGVVGSRRLRGSSPPLIGV
jgi:hypothetical protein